MKNKLFNTHAKVNKFYNFLKTKYPVSLPVELNLFETSTTKNFEDQIHLHTDKTAIIYLVYGNKPQKEILHTLAHEWCHALQYDRKEVFNRNADGVDWEKEFQATFFAEKALQEFKKWKGR